MSIIAVIQLPENDLDSAVDHSAVDEAIELRIAIRIIRVLGEAVPTRLASRTKMFNQHPTDQQSLTQLDNLQQIVHILRAECCRQFFNPIDVRPRRLQLPLAVSILPRNSSGVFVHRRLHCLLELVRRIQSARIGEEFFDLLDGSELIKQPKVNVQDPYSFRCIPQVHGSVKDTIRYVGSVIDTEINSATDNPTVCPDEDLIISAGNFHGEPIAMPMDFLCIAMAELSNISERRTYKLVSGTRDLPSFLVARPGVNSGFMIPQYTAAAIASQSKTLCMPSSADTIPTSQGQEDHVSMGANAGVKLCKVVENTERVLAIELFNAAQALEFRRPLKSSAILEKVIADYRKCVPFINEDQPMYPHIAKSVEFLQNEKID